MIAKFEERRSRLADQFTSPRWLPGDGMTGAELENVIKQMETADRSRALIRAECFALIAQKGRIGVDPEDMFQDKLDGVGILRRQRMRWSKQVQQQYLPELDREMDCAWLELGAYKGNADYSHTSPNTQLLLDIGLPGLLERVDQASKREGLTQKQIDFYQSCRIVLENTLRVTRRLAAAVEPYNPENSIALTNLAKGKPNNIYEAMQLLVLYFFIHDYILGTRIRTLGRLDVLLQPYYDRDLEQGTYTRQDVAELLKYFLHKFWSAKVMYDLPFCLSGLDGDGNDVTSELTRLIVEVYDGLNIYSPKIHIRVSEKTPADFIKRVLACIRGGNSSFVFVQDRIAIKALMDVGIPEHHAKNYVPIGCYEPAVWGMEMGCTGNGGVNLAKALEFIFNNGCDLATGKQFGLVPGPIQSYEDFIAELKRQIAHMTETAMEFVVKIEPYYGLVNPDPLLSCQYEHSVETGVDVFEGGALYNNSSMYFYSIASLTDSVCAVKKLVYEDKRFTLEELGDILKANWKDNEKLRLQMLRLPEKYGNNNQIADAVAVDFAHYCAGLVNNRPNARGGVFKASLFTIDACFATGKKTMATPDGRRAGEPLSKNLCAVTAMDKNGITALIHSVTKIDHSRFPNGSVLDVVLHPSAVSGEDGLTAFYGVLKTYFDKGGLAMHGNVFDAEQLRRAQNDPEQYKNLQVRVCGWNAYFVNLSRAEQDAFIRQAEMGA